jgi:hypothetical protein
MTIMEVPRFIIYRGRNKQFYFELNSINGAKILSSDGYEANHCCRKGIDSVRENSSCDNRYDRRLAPSQQFYFILTKADGEALAISEMYSTTQSREDGIDAVKRDAAKATIQDLSLISN